MEPSVSPHLQTPTHGPATNLAVDAAATGKPVFRLSLPGHSAKLARFHAALERRGLVTAFAGDLAGEPREPLRETDRAAAELLRRYDNARSLCI